MNVRDSLSQNFGKRKIWLFIPAIAIAFAIIPYFSSYALYAIMTVISYMIFAGSWDLLYSYSGQLSLGHALPYGLGSMFMALLSFEYGIPPLIAIFLAAAVASLVQGVVGASTIRLKAGYQAIATFLFAEAFFYIALIQFGEEGLSPFQPGFSGERSVLPVDVVYVTGILIFVGSALALYLIENSRYGLKLRAIKGDPLASEVLGINVVRQKVIIWFVSSFFAGLAGAYYALSILHFDYTLFQVQNSFLPIGMSVLGGLGTIIGPLVGGLIISSILTFLPIQFSSAETFLIYGVTIIVVLRLIPGGIVRLGNLIRKKV